MGTLFVQWKNANTGYLESFVSGDLKVGKFRHLIKNGVIMCEYSRTIQLLELDQRSFTCIFKSKFIFLHIFWPIEAKF